MLPFHLISKRVKFGTFPLFLQSFNSVKGQCGLCHNLPPPTPPSLRRKGKQVGTAVGEG